MRETVLDRVCMTLAGRAAEEVRACVFSCFFLLVGVCNLDVFMCVLRWGMIQKRWSNLATTSSAPDVLLLGVLSAFSFSL